MASSTLLNNLAPTSFNGDEGLTSDNMNETKYYVYIKPYERDLELQIILEDKEEAAKAAKHLKGYYQPLRDNFVMISEVSDHEAVPAPRFDSLEALKLSCWY